MTTLIESALDYAGLGMAVIPLHTPDGERCSCHRDDCASVGKHPRVMHGLSEASLDPAVVRRWWEMWPDANIGLAIPHGFVAVDIDGQDGIDSLKAAGYDFPQTATARTGRGYHYLYRTTMDIPPRVGFLNHVDLRGPGSYIVAAPSRHQNGKEYAWVRPPNVVARAPEWIAARSDQVDAAWRERFDTATALEGVREGDRDNVLFRLAAKLRYADVPFEAALALVLEAAAKCAPPFPERDARLKVDSAYGRYQPTVTVGENGYLVEVVGPDAVTVSTDSPKGRVTIQFSDLEMANRALDANLRVTLTQPGTHHEPYIQRLNLLSMSSRESCRRELDLVLGKDVGWTSILARAVTKAHDAYVNIDRSVVASTIPAPTQIGFVVDPMVPEDGVTIVFGGGASTKTYLTMHMAVCVALGLPWLGRSTQKRNVLWIDHETGAATFGFRLGRVCAALGVRKEDVTNLHYWAGDGIPLSDSLPGLQGAISRHNIGLVALDHVALACGGEPEKSETALRFYRAANKLKIPMLAIAHITGDGERDPAQVHKPFGTIFWHNSARRTWFVQRQQEQESSVAAIGWYNRKVNDGMKPSDFGVNVVFEEDGGPVHVLPADMRHTPLLQATRGREWEIHGVLDEPMTYLQIGEKLGLKPESVRKSIERHPGLFVRVQASDGGPGNVVQWSRASEKANPDTRTAPKEKECPSGFGGSASPPPPRTIPDNMDGQPGQQQTLSGFGTTGNGVDATTPPRCPDCSAPLFGDTCVACAGWN